MHVASELTPFAKTGGLGDVLAGLPPALAARGHEVVVVLPRYRHIAERGLDSTLARRLRRFPVQLGPETIEVELWEGPLGASQRCRVWLVDHPASFDRDGMYGPSGGGGDWPDNARRYALFCKAALAIADQLDWWPDVVHAHDWQAGPAMIYAKSPPSHRPHPRRVFTVHNLVFQGYFPEAVIEELGFPRSGFGLDGYEFYGQVNFLKAGLTYAEHVTTVSPRYAREILSPETGHGLDGLLRTLGKRLSGVLNGIDDHVWSPARDPYLPRPYDAHTLWEKKQNKQALQRELGLAQRADLPLVGSISRLSVQKGTGLLLEAMPRLLEDGLQLVVLGTGDPDLEAAMKKLAAAHSDRVRVHIGFDEGLAHRITAACDLYVMPSQFEPCGLNQLYAMAYGSPPIVRAVGGLDDSVVDFDGKSGSGTGFKFGANTDVALEAAVRRAMIVFRDTRAYTALQRRAMSQDLSW
ncbi:MAG: glycogen synthase GlgA, partial [Polyangia bacterium]